MPPDAFGCTESLLNASRLNWWTIDCHLLSWQELQTTSISKTFSKCMCNICESPKIWSLIGGCSGNMESYQWLFMKYGVLSVVVHEIWSLIGGCSGNMESYQWLFREYGVLSVVVHEIWSLIGGCSGNMESYQWLFREFWQCITAMQIVNVCFYQFVITKTDFRASLSTYTLSSISTHKTSCSLTSVP